ncbi:IS30 family transposase [Fusobacterium nucleatum]
MAFGGITHINPLIIEAAEAMGSTRWQLLWKIKLPLALLVLMSGIRNMVTMTIALAGIASFVGAGGIDRRPDIINNKERFGDWEIDTIVGAFNKGAIVTLTERTTKMLLMKYLPNGKEAKGLAKAVIDLLLPYKDFVHSITSDNGSEFASHKLISKKLGAVFYFAHPYSSWERGLNENTNGLIRQYIPKGTSFEGITDKYIKQIQYKINSRSRETLGFECPKNLFFKKAA